MPRCNFQRHVVVCGCDLYCPVIHKYLLSAAWREPIATRPLFFYYTTDRAGHHKKFPGNLFTPCFVARGRFQQYRVASRRITTNQAGADHHGQVPVRPL